MTLSEFKAWLRGFSTGIDGTPTPEQWKVIQEELAGVWETLPFIPHLPQPIGVPSVPSYPHPGLSPSIPFWPKVGEIIC